MSRLTRRIIFYGFVAMFLLITPATILYTTGYTVDWDNFTLTKTGAIFLRTIPSQTQVFLNDEIAGTPRLFLHLNPNYYTVLVKKDGYSSWQKKLEVFPQLVTEARNIFLFPIVPPVELVKDLTTSTIKSFLEDSDQKQKETQAQTIASSTAGWILHNNDIYFIASDNFLLFKTDLAGNSKSQISNASLERNSYQLMVSPKNSVLALSAAGDLYLLNTNSGLFEKIYVQVQDAVFSSDGKKFLWISRNEIWVYYIEDILIQPNKKAAEKEFITRFGQKISQAVFYPNNEYIAFVVADQIKIVELDGRDQRNTTDFINVKEPQIYFNVDNDYFYYLSEQKIFRLKL